MVYVIAEPCIGECDGACTRVCPVDCIIGPVDPDALAKLDPETRRSKVAGLQFFIDPGTCIGCGACEPECPVRAIYDEDDLPKKWSDYASLNARYFEKKQTER
jgi:formate hydrogenlyase subunit 6/NADH:ubiquinone oxidoreductase subunit I